MENLKFILGSLVVLAVVGFVGYWAFFTIEPGDVHVARQRQQELENQNKALLEQVAQLKSQVENLQTEQSQQAAQTSAPIATDGELEAPPAKTTTTTASKYQSLINDLQKLVDDKVYMKQGSQGTRVGTVQTFLNIYNKTSKKVDNDYGAGTKKDVIAFQKAQGLTADGEAGPTTFLKMIAWLKKQ